MILIMMLLIKKQFLAIRRLKNEEIKEYQIDLKTLKEKRTIKIKNNLKLKDFLPK